MRIMMNKLHMLALAGLMFMGVSNASMMGQEQMEILYTLHALDQDFAQIPMVTQNVDMFIGIAEMNKQLKELKLKNATKELKTTFLKNGALFAAAWISVTTMDTVERFAFNNLPRNIRGAVPSRIFSGFFGDSLAAGLFISKVIAGLNIHDAWKKRSELIQSLELDKEILNKLQEVKYSIDIALPADNPAALEDISAGNVA